MKTLTRSDIAEKIYEEVGISRKDAGDILDSMVGEIRDELVKGDDVKLSGFGTFLLRKKHPRIDFRRCQPRDGGICSTYRCRPRGTLYRTIRSLLSAQPRGSHPPLHRSSQSGTPVRTGTERRSRPEPSESGLLPQADTVH